MTAPADGGAGAAASGGSEALAGAYRALRQSAGFFVLPRDVVRASGAEAAAYLQGQCSQDVLALAPGDTAESLLLSPQGKVEVYFRITRVADDAFVLDTDEGTGPAMVARLERFRLRTKVEFESLDWTCVAIRGPGAEAAVIGAPDLVLLVSVPGLSGVDLLGPSAADGLTAWVAVDRAVPTPPAAWEAARIEAGVPVNGRELQEGTIAAEADLVERTVSFTKGCFTGQELVARLDARGSKVARHLCAVVVTVPGGQSPDDPAVVASLVGAPVSTPDGEHDVGHLSSVAWSPGLRSVVALATLHRRIQPTAAVTVTWTAPDGSVTPLAAEARTLPLPAA